MKNYTHILFFVFIIMYILGVAIGSGGQIRIEGQSEMYEYLTGAVAGYEGSFSESVKSVCADNLKLFAVLVLCGIFRIGPILFSGVMLFKGYAAGFASTAALRLYGLKGLVLSGANMVSVMFLLPAIAYFGVAAFGAVMKSQENRSLYIKKYFLMVLALAMVFFAESILRGALSPFFVGLCKNWSV